jgi:hypothetical protein
MKDVKCLPTKQCIENRTFDEISFGDEKTSRERRHGAISSYSLPFRATEDQNAWLKRFNLPAR